MLGVVTQRGRLGLLAIIVGIAIAATSWSPAHAIIHDVAAENNLFKPQVLTIQPGDTVIWTNYDATDHAVKSKIELLFNKPLLSGQIATLTFNTPGIYEYYSPEQQDMTGTIIVAGPSPTAVATATATASPTATATPTTPRTPTPVINLPSATAPPSPTATPTTAIVPTRAPGPPNTGTGARGDGGSATPLIVLAIGFCLAIAIGSGAIAYQSRR